MPAEGVGNIDEKLSGWPAAPRKGPRQGGETLQSWQCDPSPSGYFQRRPPVNKGFKPTVVPKATLVSQA